MARPRRSGVPATTAAAAVVADEAAFTLNIAAQRGAACRSGGHAQCSADAL